MWTRHVAPDGRPYYYNAALKTSSWTEPAELRGEKSPTCVGDCSHRWEQHRAPDGRPYFFNPATKQSRWTLDGVIVNMDETRKKSKTSSETEKTSEETEKTEEMKHFFELLDSWEANGRKIQTYEDIDQSHHVVSTIASTTRIEELLDRWIETKRKRLHEYLENTPSITVKTTWKQALEALEGKAEFERLGKYDQVDVFDAFMAKVEARAVQSQLVDDEIRQRKERRDRVALRKIFREQLRAAEIHAKLTWKEYLASEAGQRALVLIRVVEGNVGGSRPRDLFMDVIEEAEEIGL